ncbi:MAG: Ig-like domain-containing protein [Myxococcales bacterium]|nr:Ig-like domain-containing protein [Myxococcales bacterium]
MSPTRRLAVPLVALALWACPPRIDTGDDGGGVIFAGPEGGIFVRDGAVLDIPRGALSSNAQITVTIYDSGIPEVPGRKRVSFGYRFSPSGLTFKEPIKIILPYLEDRLPRGVDPATFDMRRQAGDDAYLALSGASTRTEFKVVEAKSERLGLFWITSPAQPAVSKLTIEPEQAVLKVGDTQQFTAKVTDPAGNPLDVELTWSAVAARVAKIDQTGLLTASGPGPATVTARAGTMSATASVLVMGDAKGPVTFLHENPFPTGNDLWGGTLYQGAAFFVGGNATVLSRAPGDVWTRLYSSPGVTLRAVAGSPANAVAVGTAGTTGVLIQMNGTQTPTVATFTTVEPRALWFDGTYGMAVGYGNDVIVRQNGAWVKEYSPSFETLLSVIGDGAGGFVTVGNRGSIYRYDPATRTWNSLFQTQLSVLLTAGTLIDPSGNEAWAAGGGKLWHFFSGAWTAVNLPATPALTELTAIARIDGRIVIGGKTLRQGTLLVYQPAVTGPSDGGTGGADGGTGTEWTVVALRGPQVVRGIFGAGTDGYAVGELGAIWQYSAGTFTEVSRGFYGDVADVAVSGTSVIAAVNECADAACSVRSGKVVSRVTSATWSQLGSSVFGGPLFSVAAASPTEVLAGGVGQIFRFDGQAWSPLPVSGAAAEPINDIQICGNTVWAVGPNGALYRGSTTALAAEPSLGSRDLYAIHCPVDSNVWVAGTGVLFERNGGSFVLRASSTVRHSFWRAVWSPGVGEAFAFGDARYGVYWDTSDLTVFDMPGGIFPETLAGLWGSSADNLYAVGHTILPLPFGYAVRFDGAQWSLVDAGSQRKVTAIHGSSSSEIWLGTEGGGLLRGVPP